MRREILVSASPQESWVALLEDKQLVEIMFDRPDRDRIIGDIYLGRVDAVVPGIQAAFVDIGTEKAAFLHVSDLLEESSEDDDSDGDGNGNGNGNGGGGRGRRNRNYPPIQDQLKKGQEIVVQVTKEPISTKGPRVTAQVSLPGRFLVYMPFSDHVGVSRKIDDRRERGRLRDMAKAIVPKDSGGVIVRTVGEEVTQETLEREFKRLSENWKKIQRKSKSMKAPALLRREAKLVSGVIRDLFSDKFEGIRIDSKQVYNEVHEYVTEIAPELLDRIHFHDEPTPIFDKFGVEEEIRQIFEPRVPLPSGGHLIIEQTEALVSIDVNTGKYTGRKDPEKTILKTNLDAAREVAKHLRLRDVGGIIVVDFIDMEKQENRDRVLHELRSHLGRDRARTKAFSISDLGLVEMTRQRVRPSVWQSLTTICSYCGGSGRLYTPATVVRRIERSLVRAAAGGDERKIVVRVHPEVALQVLEDEPGFVKRLGKRTKLQLDLRDDPLLREDEFQLLSGPAETDVTERYATR